MDEFEKSIAEWFNQYWVDHPERHFFNQLIAKYRNPLPSDELAPDNALTARDRVARFSVKNKVADLATSYLVRLLNRVENSGQQRSKLSGHNGSGHMGSLQEDFIRALELIETRLRQLEGDHDYLLKMEKLSFQASEPFVVEPWIDELRTQLSPAVLNQANCLIINASYPTLIELLVGLGCIPYSIECDGERAWRAYDRGEHVRVGDIFYNLLYLSDSTDFTIMVIGPSIELLSASRQLELLDICFARLMAGGEIVILDRQAKSRREVQLNASGFEYIRPIKLENDPGSPVKDLGQIIMARKAS